MCIRPRLTLAGDLHGDIDEAWDEQLDWWETKTSTKELRLSGLEGRIPECGNSVIPWRRMNNQPEFRISPPLPHQEDFALRITA